jgi:hypothetical protein
MSKGVLPTVKRLTLLEQCPEIGRSDPSYLVESTTSFDGVVEVVVLENGELRTLQNTLVTTVVNGEFISNVVESRTQMIENAADIDTPIDGRPPEYLDNDAIISRIGLVLHRDGVRLRLHEPVNHLTKRLKLLISPVDLEFGATKFVHEIHTKSDLELKAERINYEGDLSLQNLKCFYDGASIAEEYANGHASLHFHVGSVRPYAFEYFSSSVRDVGATTASCSDEFPVFVWVGDVAKGFRPLDSFVRLVRLDSIYVRVRKVSQSPLFIKSCFPIFDEFVFGSDRELCSERIGLSGVFPRQFVDQVIERGTEVMDTIANNQRKFNWPRGLRREDDIGLIPNIVILDGDVLRLARGVGFNCEQEILKMFIGAFDPFTSAVERVSIHG